MVAFERWFLGKSDKYHTNLMDYQDASKIKIGFRRFLMVYSYRVLTILVSLENAFRALSHDAKIVEIR